MSAQKLQFVDVEVQFATATVAALDEIAASVGRSREEVIAEAVLIFVALRRDAFGKDYAAAPRPTVK